MTSQVYADITSEQTIIYHLIKFETENSQCSNGDGEDVEMENTNNAPIEIDSNDEEESLSPWPQFKKLMQCKKANGNNY